MLVVFKVMAVVIIEVIYGTKQWRHKNKKDMACPQGIFLLKDPNGKKTGH